jgi:GAF domain-containing protein
MAAPYNSRIDSDGRPALTDGDLVRLIFHRLYESRDLDATIQGLLAFLGAHFHVSRVSVFENNADNTACSNTFEWCSADIPSVKDQLQNLSYAADLPGGRAFYDERGMFYCADVTQLPPRLRAVLEPQGIQSLLQCAILADGALRGYVALEECTGNRLWTRDQVSLLEFFSEVLAVFLFKGLPARGESGA